MSDATKEKRELKRGAHKRGDCVFIGAWVPSVMVDKIDGVITTIDSDRSKFLREALKEKVAKTTQI